MLPLCSRKDFIQLVAGTGVFTLLGCSSEDQPPANNGGSGGSGGSGGTGGSGGSTNGAGTGGGVTGGTSGSTSVGGTGGVGGTAGTTTTGGAGNGAAGHAGAGGSAGSLGAAGSSAGTGQGGLAGTSGSGAAGGGQGGMAGAANGGAGGKAGASGATASGGMGGMTGSAGGGGSSCGMDITAQISMNHGHTLTLPLADVMAGMAKIYNARGTATHDHYVQVTQADFSVLKSGGTVKKVSCNGGDHEFVLSCATPTQTAGDPKCDSSDMCGTSMSMLCPDPK